MTKIEQQRERLRRARLYGIVDRGYVALREAPEKCAALLDGGIDVVQLRVKGGSRTEREAWLQALLPLFLDTDVPLIINDDLELAAAYDGLGLHVGQDDTPVAVCRERLGPDRLLGLSTHSPRQAQEALAVAPLLDYFAVGPVFATDTKPDYAPVGLELVNHVAGMVPPLPWFCIGGINAGRIAQVVAAGAPAVVAVSYLLNAEDTAAAVRQLRAAFA